MKFEATGKAIRSLLSEHDQLIIPRFQRDFSWDKHNYEELLDDLLSQITYKDGKYIESSYFLGNMIFLGGRSEKSLEVIDGQQRLTTITILLAAIRNTLHNTENNFAEEIAKTIQDYYIIKNNYGEVRRRLEPKSSFPYFGNIIQDDTCQEVEASTEEEVDIKNTFDNFMKILSFDKFIKRSIFTEYDVEINEQNYIEALKILLEQIISCEIVAIYVEDVIHANKLFENINSKGKPLSPVDLIKNHIFSLVPESSAGIDNIHLSWVDMKKKLSENTSDTNFSLSFDDFFMDYLKAKYPEWKINSANAYKQFISKYDTKEKNTTFVDELIDNIDLYIRVINPKRDDFSRQEKLPIFYALQAINRFKGRQVRIPILALFIKKEQNNDLIQNKVLVNLMQFLANYHFAVFGTDMKFRSNQLTLPFRQFTEKVNSAQNKKDIREAIATLKKYMMELISKEVFIDHFKDLSFKKEGARNNSLSEFSASFAIKSIENHMSKKLVSSPDTTIEHILDEAETNIQNIGNLMTLEAEYNSRLGILSQQTSLSFQEKAKVYTESQFSMVRELLIKYENFDKDDVDDRSRKLAEYFYSNVLK